MQNFKDIVNKLSDSQLREMAFILQQELNKRAMIKTFRKFSLKEIVDLKLAQIDGDFLYQWLNGKSFEEIKEILEVLKANIANDDNYSKMLKEYYEVIVDDKISNGLNLSLNEINLLSYINSIILGEKNVCR